MNNDFRYFHFGPFLMDTKVSDSLHEEMYTDIRNIVQREKIDARKSLAGAIDKEYFFNKTLLVKYNKLLKPYMEKYIDGLLHTWHEYPDCELNDTTSISSKVQASAANFTLTSLWVNIQNEGEYNPLHDHDGDISFVLFIDVPEIIYNEECVKNGNPNGTITFLDGTPQRTPMHLSSKESFLLRQKLDPIRFTPALTPRNGDLYIFPAYLSHSVDAFKSDVTRITVSGNFILA